MDHLDPHLTILLKDFVRLCPEDAGLAPLNLVCSSSMGLES